MQGIPDVQAENARLCTEVERVVGGPVEVVRSARNLLLRHDEVLVRVERGDAAWARRQGEAAAAMAAAGVAVVEAAGGEPVELDGGRVVSQWRYEEVVAVRECGAAELGAVLATLSRWPGGETLPPAPVVEVVRRGTEELSRTEAGRGWAQQLEGMLAPLAGVLDPEGEVAQGDPLGYGLVHGDLHRRNLLATTRGTVVCDLEVSGAAPRSWDLATTLLRGRRYHDEPSALNVLEACRRRGGPGRAGFDGFGQLVRLYAVMLATDACLAAVQAPDPVAATAAAAQARRRLGWLEGTSDAAWEYV
jgi:hypothetical protein